MKTMKILGICAMAVLLVGWGVTSVLAKDPSLATAPPSTDDHERTGGEVLFGDSVGCGAMACVDVYKVKCLGKSRHLHANVTDNDGAGDNVSVSTVAIKPGSIKGKSVQCFTDLSGLGASCSTLLDKPTGGSMDAYVLVSNITDIFVSYLLNLNCDEGAPNFNPTPVIATLVQDQ